MEKNYFVHESSMVKFVYNSACSPYVAKDVAMPIAEEVFYTILRYVSAHTVSVLVRYHAPDQLWLTANFSLVAKPQ
jgi:hypothetical protein